MKNFSMAALMICCQAITTLTFGMFFILIMIVRYPGGEQVLKEMFSVQTVPYHFIISVVALNFLGMFISTSGNITMVIKNKTKTIGQLNLKEKELRVREKHDKTLKSHGFDLNKLDKGIEALKEELRKPK